MKKLHLALVMLALALAPTTAIAQLPQYVLVDITPGSPYSEVVANHINNAGQMTGYGVFGRNQIHAFIDTNGAFADLGNLGFSASDGIAINDSGNLAVVGEGPGSTALYYANGKAQRIGNIDGGYTTPYATNNLGDIVGSGVNGDGNIVGFSWIASKFTDLSSRNIYRVASINDSRQYVGTSLYFWSHGGYGLTAFHAFSFSKGVFTDLGQLNGNPETNTEAFGINSAGDIVGYSTASDGLLHAFLYAGGVMKDLGSFGGNETLATAISNTGQIIGNTENPYGAQLGAFLYDNGTMSSLAGLVVGSTSSFGALVVTSINDYGWITGYGYVNGGVTHGFIAAPLTSAVPTAISLAQSSVSGGGIFSGAVTIDSPAPPGGVLIPLSSSNDKIALVGGAIVPAGQITGIFRGTTAAVKSMTSVTITATANGASVTSSSINVVELALKAFKISPTYLVGGVGATGSLIFDISASSDTTVALASSDPSVAQVPGSVTVSAGNSSQTFPITTSPVRSSKRVTLTASCDGITKTAVLTLTK